MVLHNLKTNKCKNVCKALKCVLLYMIVHTTSYVQSGSALKIFLFFIICSWSFTTPDRTTPPLNIFLWYIHDIIPYKCFFSSSSSSYTFILVCLLTWLYLCVIFKLRRNEEKKKREYFILRINKNMSFLISCVCLDVFL